MSYTGNDSVAGNGSVSFINTGTYTLNSLSTPCKNGTTDNRAAGFIGVQFKSYRVIGMSYRLTATMVTTSTPQPTYLWFIPYRSDDPANTTAPSDPGELAQIAGAKIMMLDAYGASGRYTRMKGYIDMKKLRGDSASIKDDDFVGNMTIAGLFGDPFRLYNYQFGMSSVSRDTLQASNVLHYNITTTYYLEFFDVGMAGIE